LTRCSSISQYEGFAVQDTPYHCDHYRSLSSTFMNEHGELFEADISVADDDKTASIRVKLSEDKTVTINVKDHQGDELKTLQNNACLFKCYWTDQTNGVSCFEMFRPNKVDIPKKLKDACKHNQIIGLTLTSCNPAEDTIQVKQKVEIKTCKRCYYVTQKEKKVTNECCQYGTLGYRKICKLHCRKVKYITKKKQVCKETLSAFC
ncbi:hypothetical protein KUTeg_019115, partial [Tegillarca granosa]